MKPVSIIFLVVALLFGIGGYACMRVGQSMAAKEGVDLLAGTAVGDEDYIYTYEYDDDTIGKISVNVKEADINIIGGASKPYVELINFAEGMYEFTSSNRILTVSNNSDFSEISDIASLVFNFKGLRSLVNYNNIRGRDKTVNIYVTDDCPVKIFECKVERGNVSISSNSSQSDYNVTIGEGSLSLDDITTTSAANISIGTGGLIIDSCDISKLSLEIEKGDAELIASSAVKISAKLGTGDFRFGYRGQLGSVNLDLFTELGGVKLDGESKGGFWEVSDLPTNSGFEVTVSKGDIVLNSNMTEEY